MRGGEVWMDLGEKEGGREEPEGGGEEKLQQEIIHERRINENGKYKVKRNRVHSL